MPSINEMSGRLLIGLAVVVAAVMLVRAVRRVRAGSAHGAARADGSAKEAIDRQLELSMRELSQGNFEEAVGYAEAALSIVDNGRDLPTGYRIRGHHSLGRALSRAGRHEEALVQLRAVNALLAKEPEAAPRSFAALAQANLSLVLRRLDRLAEAMEEAAVGANVDASADVARSPIMASGPAWAQLALALAQTDAGQDGRGAAAAALATFRRLNEKKTRKTEELAYGCYAMAYAAHAQGDDAAALAAEAVERFTALHQKVPALFGQRLADARALAAGTAA